MTMVAGNRQPVDVVFFCSFAANREDGSTIHDVASRLDEKLRNHGAQSIAWQTQPFQSDALRVQVSAHFYKTAHPTRLVHELSKVSSIETMDLFAFALGETQASGTLDMLDGPHIDRIYRWFRSNSTLRTMPLTIRPTNTSQFRLLTGVRQIDDIFMSAVEHWLCVLLHLTQLRPGQLAVSQENEMRQEHERLGACIDKAFDHVREWLYAADRSAGVELEHIPRNYAYCKVNANESLQVAMDDVYRTIVAYRNQPDIARIAKDYDATEVTWEKGLAAEQWVLPLVKPDDDRMLPPSDKRSVSSTIIYLLEKNKQAADRFNWITGALSAIIVGLLSVSAPRIMEMNPTGIAAILALLALGGTIVVFLSLLLSYALPALFPRLTKVEASNPDARNKPKANNKSADKLINLSKPEIQKKFRSGADFAYALNDLESPLVRCKMTAVDFQNSAEVVETAKRISISRFWVNIAIYAMVLSLCLLVASIVWHIFPLGVPIGTALPAQTASVASVTQTAVATGTPLPTPSSVPSSASPASP